MKKTLTILALLAFSAGVWAQENMVSVSYGFEWANMDVSDSQARGWRLNGVYEFNPGGGQLAHGIGFGYASVSADYSTNEGGSITTDVNAKVSTVPIYYAPKFILGSGKAKPFVKGAIGTHFSKLTTTTSSGSADANGMGFYGGGGGGLMVSVKDNIFLNAEYEIAWLSNSYYEGGWLQSALIGIGVKF